MRSVLDVRLKKSKQENEGPHFQRVEFRPGLGQIDIPIPVDEDLGKLERD